MLKQLAKAPSLDWRTIDQVVAMPLGSWLVARAMLEARGDRSGSRMAYSVGRKIPDLAIEVRWTGGGIEKHASMEDQSKAVRAFLKLER